MNYKVAICLSFFISLAIIIYAFITHANMYPSHTETVEAKDIFKAIQVFLYPALFICAPWGIAISFKSKANILVAYIFSVLSTILCVYLFIPPPLHPSEAIGFVLLMTPVE
ncbi:hypothetical protein [Methylotenera sp.]|uniref:hypothetical protein n=1 Tax=Methylotenera sp. TaxID=2051956 RepID=UPI002488F2F7|nr:hypothetical protein [Methylotenera sp.]MDI1298788.1 hypothetical protein [Methylotenera sp.]